MTTTYTWAVVQMDAYPEYEGQSDVVFTIHWTLTGINGMYQGGNYGSQSVTLDEGSTFTPYADLTQEQVIGWVKSAMGDDRVAGLEANVAQQIADQINPPVVTPPLPWGVQ